MDIAELTSSLRLTVTGLHKLLRKQMYSVSAYSLTEMETIGHLMRNPALLPTELAALARVKTQSMSQILKKLEEQNVIARTPSEDDKRKVYISLTDAGRKMVDKTRNEKDEWLKNAIESSLTEKEKDLLARALPVINKLMQ